MLIRIIILKIFKIHKISYFRALQKRSFLFAEQLNSLGKECPGCAPKHHFYVNFSLRKQIVYIPRAPWALEYAIVNIILRKIGFPKNPKLSIFYLLK